MIDRRTFLAGTGAVLLAAPLAAAAQQATKIYRIGYLQTGPRAPTEHILKALEQGLRERGYAPGRNLIIEYCFADGRPERLPELAAELVRLKVDVIVTALNPVTVAAKQATTTIPIVTTLAGDPVGTGFVASLARPGGNITGLTLDVAPRSGENASSC